MATTDRSTLDTGCRFILLDPSESPPFSLMSWAALQVLMGGKTPYFYDLTAATTFALLTGGTKDVSVNVPGLVVGDRVVELQPTADMPPNLTLGTSFVIATDTLRIRFTTPAVLSGSYSIPLKLTVFR